MGFALVLNRRSQAPAEETPAFGAVAERFRRAGELERAVQLCQEGLGRFPEYLSARVTLGWALLDLGRYSEARIELERVVKRAPDNLAAIRGLAQLHDRSDQADMDQAANWTPEPEPVAVAVPQPVSAPAQAAEVAAAAVVDEIGPAPAAIMAPAVDIHAEPQPVQLLSPIDVTLEASLGLLAVHAEPIEDPEVEVLPNFELVAPEVHNLTTEIADAEATQQPEIGALNEIDALEAMLVAPAALAVPVESLQLDLPEAEPAGPPAPVVAQPAPQLARFLRVVEPVRDEPPLDEYEVLEQDGWLVDVDDLGLRDDAMPEPVEVTAPVAAAPVAAAPPEVEVLAAEPVVPAAPLVPSPAPQPRQTAAVIALERFLRKVEARKVERIRRSAAS